MYRKYCQYCFSQPLHGSHLHRVPWTGKWRGVGKVQVAQSIDGHMVKQGGGKNIDPPGNFGTAMANDLGT
jgi:hypothetical protein